MLAPSKAKWWVAGFLLFFVLLCAIGVSYALWHQTTAPTAGSASFNYTSKHIQLDGKDYTLQVADTGPKRELGLGQRSNLGPREGMLFAYNAPADDYCFWMKDMRFSLDMIWLDSNKRIVHIEPSVSPGTYPHSFCPGASSQYVIELNAGRAHDLRLQTGQQLSF